MNKSEIKIGDKIIGEGKPLYFIADIASNHDGELERAFKLIELAKEAGADAAKFQNFKAERIVSEKGFNSLNGKLSHQSSWGQSVYEVYQEASVPYNWTEKLKEKCDEVGIEYLTSPYDFKSVDQVEDYLNAYKIGSGDITWTDIIDYIAQKGKPVIISTGASEMEDVERAMTTIKKHTDEIVLMQCNTNYTVDAKNFNYINLNVLKKYAQKYPNTILGLSDHTKGFSAVLGAVALGARVIEKHFTDDNNRTGPDHKFAMTPDSWSEMVKRATELYKSLGDGNKKIEDNEKESVIVQRRALRYSNNLESGAVIKKEDLFPLRPIPEEGIPPYKIDDVVGQKLNKSVSEDDLVRWSDLDND
ncbi:N-acetylneuraminate synthase family protein [Halanaerobacter jeridensis]|uniref:N-acetylneuraminate synthase n=1 Tax=Halanaerobacter jeridensis TaxID=706427 RepID=A0A938XWB9_9FIRM|nr:N-acetylneuraminate synthase family protein [Halanaerobacter jeridensis]MBM7557456.1 N-acetylneuraminate synthase [Halanaerobacter jeridensis]